ncbi:MAG: FAA hydrolase family protein [Alphaproteobacteria bacterium]|nr:MAG: FAA hydrolase family protein [Alphaproteobacteria bacterium]
MKLVTFEGTEGPRLGVLKDELVIDLASAAPDLPREMMALLEAGPEALKEAEKAADNPRASSRPLSEVKLLPPVLRPRKILAIGLNYHDHINEVKEAGRKVPEVPVVFNKQVTAINGPTGDIHLPKVSEALDYEGELAMIIGRTCRHVSKEKALSVVAGFAVANDVSVRDWQKRTPTMTMGKSFDTHCPLGPSLTTTDEVDPHNLGIRTWVNDELRQSSNTKHLIFSCETIIEHLTAAFTLEPGDVILTGTPSGVAMAMDPPNWLKEGDVVRVEVEGLGEIVNKVVKEP